MKNIYSYLVFVVLQSTFVYSRTVNDVLVDFQPVFDENHGEISTLQQISHNEGSRQVGDIKSNISLYASEAQVALQDAMYDIRNQVNQIVGEAGMIPHEDLIKHCFDNKNEDIVSLTKDKNTGTNVCNQLGNKAIETLNNILNEYYNEQNTWHTNLESIRQRCADKTTPFEMQTCLIEYLYLVSKPHIQEMRVKLYDFIENNEEYTKRIIGDLKICFSIVSEKTKNDRLPIIAAFKKCVVEAAENLP